MKVKFTHLAICVLVTVAGCKKDSTNNETITPQSKLLGKWAIQSDDVKIYSKGQVTGGGLVTYKPSDNAFAQFNANGSGQDGRTFTYTFANNIITYNYPKQKDDSGFENEAETSLGTVQELTEHKMVIFFDYTTKNSSGQTEGNSVTEILTK